jgi:hypothetical protein
LIKLSIEINESENYVEVTLPEKEPSIDAIIKTVMICQFDHKATDSLNSQIKKTYGEEYHSKVINSMSEIVNSFRELVQNSLALDPEAPATPVVFLSPRMQK